MEKVQKLLEKGNPVNNELAIKYITARLSGYAADELYGVLVDDIVLVLDMIQLKEIIEDAPKECVDDFQYLLNMPGRAGMLRMFNSTAEGSKIGWVKPPAEVEAVVAAEGLPAQHDFSCIICSFALHLCNRSMLPDLVWRLSERSNTLVVISPTKFPLIGKPVVEKFSLTNRNKRVHFRTYNLPILQDI